MKRGLLYEDKFAFVQQPPFVLPSGKSMYYNIVQRLMNVGGGLPLGR